MTLPAWDTSRIEPILAVDPVGTGRWKGRHGDANPNGRAFGGQLLGQAMSAALKDVPRQRAVTMMQFLFMQGADPQQAVELEVDTLQEGKRFSSRHVRAWQGNGRKVLDAQVTCCEAIESPAHGEPMFSFCDQRPEDLPTLHDLDPALRASLSALGGYAASRKPSIDFRIPQPERQLGGDMNGRFCFWMRAAHALPADGHLQAAAFAYTSDWWINFSSLGLHLRGLGGRRLYIASLNHAFWLHRPFRVDEWLYVDSQSPASAGGRGLSISGVHDAQGSRVATITQETLMAYAG